MAPWIKHVTRVAAVAAAVGLLAGCAPGSAGGPARAHGPVAPAASPSSRSVPPYPPVSASPAAAGSARRMAGPTSAQRGSADAMATAGARVLLGADTAVDAEENQTAVRAALGGWLTPAYAGQVRRYPPIAAPGATWNGWVAHRAYLRVTSRLGADDHPPDTTTTAHRQVLAVVSPIGRDGWHGAAVPVTVFVTLARTPAGWLLASTQTSSTN